MEDETLEISRCKLFDLLSKTFTDITDSSIRLMKDGKKEPFAKDIETIIDDLNHNILENCKREKPVVKEKNTRLELEWS